ncbi:MAG: hypothetical protein K0V04_01520, partial [Deltaproteobacteria bacterium]|nr:hypothetical protein [Deltaproteobacteria bacterium]
MPRARLGVAALGAVSLLVVANGCDPNTQTETASAAHQRAGEGGTQCDKGTLPAWVGWPADPNTLQAAIDARDAASLRAHAWKLWAGINQPLTANDTRPRWWNWPTTTQLFESGNASQGTSALPKHRHAARIPSPAVTEAEPGDHDHTDECFDENGNGTIFLPSPTYAIPRATAERFGLDVRCSDPEYYIANTSICDLSDGEHFQSNGDILVATESYSPESAKVIEAEGYNDAATLNALWDDGVKNIDRLPVRQITTKHMLWPVKASGASALPVFRDLPKAKWCQYNGYETWDHMVAVDPAATTGGKATVDFLFGVHTHSGDALLPTKHVEVDVVPMSDFYVQTFDDAAWNALDRRDQMLLDAASQWAHGKPFEPGDHVVSVAMHIVTKEIPQWTLQSVWWSDQPSAGPYAADRPSLPDATGPWQHYLLTVADGIPTTPNGPTLPIAYNPYIELAATHPVATNCRNCHVRAALCTGEYLTPKGPGPLANIDVN